jgi:hypothetical protein
MPDHDIVGRRLSRQGEKQSPHNVRDTTPRRSTAGPCPAAAASVSWRDAVSGEAQNRKRPDRAASCGSRASSRSGYVAA